MAKKKKKNIHGWLDPVIKEQKKHRLYSGSTKTAAKLQEMAEKEWDN